MPVERTKTTPRRGKNIAGQADLRRYVCRNSGKKGHRPTQCPEPKKCFICRQEGHKAAQCPEKGTETQNDIIAMLIAMASKTEEPKPPIYLDSACPVHLLNNPALLLNTRPTPTPLSFSSVTNHCLSITQVGTARIKTDKGILKLEQAYLAENSPVNILSLGQLEQKGWKIALQDSPEGRYIARGNTKFSVEFQNGYWTLAYNNFINKLDWTQEKRLQIEYIPTTRQVADVPTKGGHSEAMQIKLVSAMGLMPSVGGLGKRYVTIQGFTLYKDSELFIQMLQT